MGDLLLVFAALSASPAIRLAATIAGMLTIGVGAALANPQMGKRRFGARAAHAGRYGLGCDNDRASSRLCHQHCRVRRDDRCGSGVCNTIHPGGIRRDGRDGRRSGFASGKALTKRCVKLGPSGSKASASTGHVTVLQQTFDLNLGFVPDHIDPDLTIALMIGGIRQALIAVLMSEQRPDPEKLTDEIWAFMAGALRLTAGSGIEKSDRDKVA